jgi:hypothetical protein
LVALAAEALEQKFPRPHEGISPLRWSGLGPEVQEQVLTQGLEVRFTLSPVSNRLMGDFGRTSFLVDQWEDFRSRVLFALLIKKEHERGVLQGAQQIPGKKTETKALVLTLNDLDL